VQGRLQAGAFVIFFFIFLASKQKTPSSDFAAQQAEQDIPL